MSKLEGDNIYPQIAFNETRTVISLDIVSALPISFEEYKAFLYDFLKTLDETDQDLFESDEYEVKDI